MCSVFVYLRGDHARMAASTTLTPEQRSMRARLASQTRWGRTPPDERRQNTTPARTAFFDRFLAEVDEENPGLPEADRQKLAESKLSAYMTSLALKSSRSRTANREEAA